MDLALDLNLISKILAIIDLILIMIAIYYAFIIDKRTKNHIRKLENDKKNNENTPHIILTDEEFGEMNEKFKKEIRELYIKPNHVLIVLTIIITIGAIASIILKDLY